MSLCSPQCPHCGGSGYVRYDRPIYDPKFGKLEFCPSINPIKLFGRRSGLTETELGLSLKLMIDVNGIGRVIETVREVLDQGWGMIFLWGEFGLGKTTLLKSVVAESIRARKEGTYTRMVDIVNNLRSSYAVDNANEEFSQRLKFWMNVPLLCIDEFTRVKETDYVEEQRFSILDQRYEDALQKKSITIMASNTDPRHLDEYLADRIFDGRLEVIHIEGISARPNFKKSSK